jgi:GntR family transcriptional repressor for pyruvate dehydrogenase complex
VDEQMVVDTPKLTRRTLSETLLTQLRQQILTGNLRPGEQLPSERAIGDAFGVGRTTVREALQGLVVGGFVQRTGGRLIVIDKELVPAQTVGEAVKGAQLSVREIFETRKLIEVEGARQAALHHTEQDMVALRQLLLEMDTTDRALYHQRHQEFHLQIMQMSKNRVLAHVFERSMDMFFKSPGYWKLFSSPVGSRPRPLAGGGRAGHERIVAALAGGSPAESAQVMYQHLDQVEQVLIERIEPSQEDLATSGTDLVGAGADSLSS